MTLADTSRLIRAAAEAQDLDALEAARLARQDAIASLPSQPPSEELHRAIADSIVAGEEARVALRVIKQRLRKDTRRLAAIEQGFLRALHAPDGPHFDYKG